MKLTPEAERAIGAIAAIGGRPLLVGGCVRDHLLGVESKDIDIEVHGPVSVERVATVLRELGKVDEVGKSFGVLKMGGLDISFPRRDRRIGDGHTGFAIEIDHDMTVEEALERRDFTINSIAYDPIIRQYIDPFGGRRALALGVLRHTSEHFADDPLRVMRGVQFAARFGFDLADDTVALCRALKPRRAELSIERIWMEWWKILTKGKLLPAFLALEATCWAEFFPGLSYEGCRLADYHLGRHARVESPEHRASLLVALAFRDAGPALATEFLTSIGAPGWLRKSTLRLIKPYQGMTAERMARFVRIRDWLVVHGAVGSHVQIEAEKARVMDRPRPRLLSGEHLKAAGYTPGPIFAEILTAAELAQDTEGWRKLHQALAWLSDHYPAQEG